MLRRENFDFKIVIVNLFEYIVLIFNYCNRKDRFIFFKVRFYIYNGENFFIDIVKIYESNKWLKFNNKNI